MSRDDTLDWYDDRGATMTASPEEGRGVCIAVADTTTLISLGGVPCMDFRLPMPLEEVASRLNLHHEDDGSPLTPDELPLARAARGETVNDAVFRMRRPGGEEWFVRWTAMPLLAADGTVTGAVSVSRPADDEVDRGRGRSWTQDLVVAVNHELRSPLTTVLGHAELLGDARGRLPRPVAESIEAIQRGSRAMERVVRQMTELFGAGAADTGLDLRAVDVGELVDALARSVHERAARRRVALTVSVSGGSTAVSADPTRLRRAIGDVLGDALGQAPAGTSVGLHVTARAERVLVTVTDEGEGIAAEERASALWSFRGPDDEARHPRSGLVVANAVALAHGGQVTLDDHQPRGLRVVLDVPRVPPG